MSKDFLSSWIILPAAGVGSRMLADKPKQYLKLNQQTVLENTLLRLSLIPKLKGIVVALAEGDPYWQDISKPANVKIITTTGGKERCHSVINALQAISDQAQENDWVMVHDAARPCVDIADIACLHNAIKSKEAVGGILGLPVADTLKQVNQDGYIEKTVSRDQLWRALTPQMFSYSTLYHALQNAIQNNVTITDDSQVIELIYAQPVIVESSPMNIKITQPNDLRLAALYLQELRNDN